MKGKSVMDGQNLWVNGQDSGLDLFCRIEGVDRNVLRSAMPERTSRKWDFLGRW